MSGYDAVINRLQAELAATSDGIEARRLERLVRLAKWHAYRAGGGTFIQENRRSGRNGCTYAGSSKAKNWRALENNWYASWGVGFKARPNL